MIKAVRTLFWLLVMVVLVTFLFQNASLLVKTEHVRLNLLIRDFSSEDVPIYGIVLIAFLVGLGLGGGWGLLGQIKAKRQVREINKVLAERERELSSLRNLPIVENATHGGGPERGAKA